MRQSSFNKDIYLKELNLSIRNYQHLSFLIKDERDFEEFMSEFWDEGNKFFAINDYRLHKIKSMNISFDEFRAVYYKKGEIEALEMLFQHPVVKSDVDILIDKVKSGELTLEMLFEMHKQEPGRHLLQILKSV